jgi:hypothetical protein
LDEGDCSEVDEGVSETRHGMQAEELDEAWVFETRYETPAEEVDDMACFETRSEMPEGEIAVAELLGTRSEMPTWEGEDGSPGVHEGRRRQQRIQTPRQQADPLYPTTMGVP